MQGVGQGLHVDFLARPLPDPFFAVFLEKIVGVEHGDVARHAFAFAPVPLDEDVAVERLYVGFGWICLNDSVEIITELGETGLSPVGFQYGLSRAENDHHALLRGDDRVECLRALHDSRDEFIFIVIFKIKITDERLAQQQQGGAQS